MAHDWITKHSRVFKKKAVANKRLNKTREAVGDIKDHHAEKKKTRLIYSHSVSTGLWMQLGRG